MEIQVQQQSQNTPQMQKKKAYNLDNFKKPGDVGFRSLKKQPSQINTGSIQDLSSPQLPDINPAFNRQSQQFPKGPPVNQNPQRSSLRKRTQLRPLQVHLKTIHEDQGPKQMSSLQNLPNERLTEKQKGPAVQFQGRSQKRSVSTYRPVRENQLGSQNLIERDISQPPASNDDQKGNQSFVKGDPRTVQEIRKRKSIRMKSLKVDYLFGQGGVKHDENSQNDRRDSLEKIIQERDKQLEEEGSYRRKNKRISVAPLNENIDMSIQNQILKKQNKSLKDQIDRQQADLQKLQKKVQQQAEANNELISSNQYLNSQIVEYQKGLVGEIEVYRNNLIQKLENQRQIHDELLNLQLSKARENLKTVHEFYQETLQKVKKLLSIKKQPPALAKELLRKEDYFFNKVNDRFREETQIMDLIKDKADQRKEEVFLFSDEALLHNDLFIKELFTMAVKQIFGKIRQHKKEIVDNCSICQTEIDKNKLDFKRDDEAIVLECGHYYHFKCLQVWMKEGRQDCLICKNQIVQNFSKKVSIETRTYQEIMIRHDQVQDDIGLDKEEKNQNLQGIKSQFEMFYQTEIQRRGEFVEYVICEVYQNRELKLKEFVVIQNEKQQKVLSLFAKSIKENQPLWKADYSNGTYVNIKQNVYEQIQKRVEGDFGLEMSQYTMSNMNEESSYR